MAERYRSHLALLPAPPVLITESEDEFERIRNDLEREINPQGIVEKIFVLDFALLNWDIRRLQNSKPRIINAHFHRALSSFLNQLLCDPEQYGFEVEQEAEDIAAKWFTDKAVKKQVLELLRAYQLDESAIEAEAIRQSAAEIERLDRLLASAESRRSRVLRMIVEYQGGFGQRLRNASSQLIDAKALPPEGTSGDGLPAAG